MQSERPLGALLSGGLDSSLVAGIAAKLLSEENKRLTTFSIGMDAESPDIKYARKVADHINSIHHEIIIPVEIWIENLKNVIRQIETYDITTIRASTGQYLLAKWISENTDIKVLLNGDGADELESGYLYFYNAPGATGAHNENLRLLENIHYYDVLRVDRGISAWGLEARVPFLSKDFVDLYLSIDKNLRHPLKGEGSRIEKYLIRNAFTDEDLIPSGVLWRKKEAFSDGVSHVKKSWFEYIKEYIEAQVSDEEFAKHIIDFPSKEAYWYKKIYSSYYPVSNNFLRYWMPKWSNETKDPSARVLKIN
jgi:asparagine synthase (glutamine-hydrolysing)